MNKFQIILRPVGWPVNGRTNQHLNLEQTMAFRINTMEVRIPPSILTTIWVHPVFQQALSICHKLIDSFEC